MDGKLRKKLEKWLAGRGIEETIITAMSDEDLIKHTIGYVQDVEPLLAWTEHFASIVPGGAVTSEGDEPGPGPHEVTEVIEWEYINSEEAWNASYASGALKKYYAWADSVQPYKEDLWNEAAQRGANWNDIVKDDQGNPIEYEDGYHYVDADGNACVRCWKGALGAAEAKWPWLCVSFDDDIEGVVKVTYNETTITPWGTTPRKQSFGTASLPDEFDHNEWIIPLNGPTPELPAKDAFTVTRTYITTD